jgi:prepilin-type processing-associated H-X9-DG protein
LEGVIEAMESQTSTPAQAAPVAPAVAATAAPAPLSKAPLGPAAPAQSWEEAAFGADPADFYPTVVHAHGHPEDQAKDEEGPPTSPPEAASPAPATGPTGPTSPTGPRGFTIRELFVVLGLVALLIAFGVPLASAVRARAAQVTCADRLATMATAARNHVAQHQGYLPLVGHNWRKDLYAPQLSGPGLQDPAEQHYVYYTDAGVRRPAPITAALAVSLGVPVDCGSRTALDADLQSPRVTQLFQCPAQDPQGRGYSIGCETWSTPAEFSSYDFNESLMSHKRRKPLLPHGQVSALKSPERFFYIWEWYLAPADLLQWQELDGKSLDYTRHACRANVLFADWHVQSVPLTPAGLAGVLIAEAHPGDNHEVTTDFDGR